MQKSLLAQYAGIVHSDFIGLVAAKDRYIVWANEAMHRLFGYESGELIGQPIRILFIDEVTYKPFANEVVTAIEGKKVYSGTQPRRRKDGTTGWYQINISQLVGQPEVFVGSFIDETARHQLMEELERHRAVVQDQTELISRFLPDRTFCYVNDVYCRLFGKSREELLGCNWHPVVHPVDLPMIEAELAKLSYAHPVVTIEIRVMVAGGGWRWFQFVNRGLFDADGRLVEVQSVGRDITDLMNVERRLRENEERLDLALLGSGMVLWDWDIPEQKVTPGHRWSEILGYSDQELGVNESAWMGLIHPSDLEVFMQKIDAHIQGENARFESEHRLKHKDGHWVNVLAYGKISSRDVAGKPTRMIGTIQDISHRKRLNEEGLDLLKRIEGLIRDSSHKSNEPSGALVKLTKRETQILGMIAEGMTSGQIAQKLKLATNTVISHRQKMMVKLDLHSTAAVVRFALDNATARQ